MKRMVPAPDIDSRTVQGCQQSSALLKALSPVTRNLCCQTARGNRSGATKVFPRGHFWLQGSIPIITCYHFILPQMSTICGNTVYSVVIFVPSRTATAGSPTEICVAHHTKQHTFPSKKYISSLCLRALIICTYHREKMPTLLFLPTLPTTSRQLLSFWNVTISSTLIFYVQSSPSRNEIHS